MGATGYTNPAAALPLLGVLFNVEDYGAKGDGVTDDFLAFQSAWNALLASPYAGNVFLPRAVVYRVVLNGRVVAGPNGQYAALPIPLRLTDPTHPELSIGILGVGQAYVTRQYPGAGSTTALNATSSVVLLDYSTPFVWSATLGHPSFVGGPDVDKNGNNTNVHFTVQHVTFRQPNNPSLCGLNLESCATAWVTDMAADVNVALDTSAEPTRPTGVPLMLPRTGNAVNVKVENYLAWGYYAGYPVAEHCDGKSIEVIACKIAVFFRRPQFSHAAQISWLSTEECPWGLAGYDPSGAGPNLGVVACPNWVVQIQFWDVEDFDRAGTASWMYTGAAGALKAHVYDPNNALKGWAWYMRVDSGANAGDFETAYVTGGSNFGLYQLAARDTAVTRLAGGNPAVAPPDTPTIGVATAGNASATVAFTPAATGQPATGFTATSTPGGFTGTGGTSPVTVAGLTNGTAYTFTVHATNAAGSSGESAPSNQVTPSGGAPTTYAADTFTRADSATTLGTSSGGQLWSALNGTWGIKTNRGYMAVDGGGNSYDVAVLDAAHGLVTYTIDVTPKLGAIDIGVVGNVQDVNNLVFWDISGDTQASPTNITTRLFKRSGGSFTGITPPTTITVNGNTTYTLKMVVAATTISCFINNSLIFTSTGGATGLEAQTKFGLIMATAQNDQNTVWDNLLVTS